MPDQASFDEVLIHETACIDDPCRIGRVTRIRHLSPDWACAAIWRDGKLGQKSFSGGTLRPGVNLKIHNHLSSYDRRALEDHLLCGPSTLSTNLRPPRSDIVRKRHDVRP